MNQLHFQIRRGDQAPITKGKRFTGIFYPVRFRVSQPICIEGVSFYGRHRDCETSQAIIGLQIKESIYNDTSRGGFATIMAEKWFVTEDLQKQKEFSVHLSDEGNFVIPADMWVEIKFQIDDILCNHLPEEKTRGNVVEKKSGVKFEFMASSSQLSEIMFRLAGANDEEKLSLIKEQGAKSQPKRKMTFSGWVHDKILTGLTYLGMLLDG